MCKHFPVFFLFLSTTLMVSGQEPVVQTTSGHIRGFTRQYNGYDVLQFVGVPYAAPPIGELRFKQPKWHPSWKGIRNATTFGPSCLQTFLENDVWLLPNQNLNEDCLQLNVYVPGQITKSSRKAVMIWIHGGGFQGGQGTMVDRSYLALQSDVIVVSINYRLGVFGFLSTGDASAPGNFGLWDQRLAIKWVKKNIGNFGGDPSNITIFGESAGGVSVGLLSVSPRNRGLFQRAITQSGTVYSPMALSKHFKTSAINLGKLLNCSTKRSSDLITCLRTIPAEQIHNVYENNALYKSPVELTFENHMGPVVDGDIVEDDPAKTLVNASSESYKMFKSIDVMAGTNNAEGGELYLQLKRFQDKYQFNISTGIPKTVLCDLVAPAISRDFYQNKEAVAEKMCELYGAVKASSDELSRSIVNVYGDLEFVIPTVKAVKLHSDMVGSEKSTYQYIFTHEASYTWVEDRPPWLLGANHADELPFVFGLDAMYKPNERKPAIERKLAEQMMLYWTNFAKTGNPNIPVAPEVLWPQYNVTHKYYMNLSVPQSLGQDLYDDRVQFWSETIPNILSASSASWPLVYIGTMFLASIACIILFWCT